MKFNNTNDGDWGFYVDIEKIDSYVNSNNFTKTKNNLSIIKPRILPYVKSVLSDDLSYSIDIYDYNNDISYEKLYTFDGCENNCNLYTNIWYTLEYYKNKFTKKNITNLLIKVTSTTFATIALTYVVLTIL
jgi:hypothetical protein